jgi:hypothetical protein
MPGWLFWTFVGLAAWCAFSLVFALLIGSLFGRERVPKHRLVVVAGATSMRARGRNLRKAS